MEDYEIINSWFFTFISSGDGLRSCLSFMKNNKNNISGWQTQAHL